ncbi:uncharacterized protein VTP21DRAFT_8770 [Calcarisporiella thermophila]|uniref:uncharacterized protein n=1 Tax=Calcarisporiella thermophila TaxID=911321 RepID=UPI003741FF82
MSGSSGGVKVSERKGGCVNRRLNGQLIKVYSKAARRPLIWTAAAAQPERATPAMERRTRLGRRRSANGGCEQAARLSPPSLLPSPPPLPSPPFVTAFSPQP